MCLPIHCLVVGLYVTLLIAYLSLYCNRRFINLGEETKLLGIIKATNKKSRTKLLGFSALNFFFFFWKLRERRSTLINLSSKNQLYAGLLLQVASVKTYTLSMNIEFVEDLRVPTN
jgi:hypothetical protein